MIPGLRYDRDVISEDHQRAILRYFDDTPDQWQPGPGGRMVRQYGRQYDYEKRCLGKELPGPPDCIRDLMSLFRVVHPDLRDDHDQCIINRYLPGEGISAHTDHPAFDDGIACFTIGSGAIIEFANPKTREKRTVYTTPGSLYVMTGESRYEWTHCMPARKNDIGYGARGTRYSITIRNIKRSVE